MDFPGLFGDPVESADLIVDDRIGAAGSGLGRPIVQVGRGFEDQSRIVPIKEGGLIDLEDAELSRARRFEGQGEGSIAHHVAGSGTALVDFNGQDVQSRDQSAQHGTVSGQFVENSFGGAVAFGAGGELVRGYTGNAADQVSSGRLIQM